MKVTINGIEVTGTPSEIAEVINLNRVVITSDYTTDGLSKEEWKKKIAVLESQYDDGRSHEYQESQQQSSSL